MPENHRIHEPSRLQDGDGDGYQTPTSEGDRISKLSRPPTLKRRKKVVRHKKKLPEHLLFENSREGKQELEAFFRSFTADSNSLGSNKKPRISEDQ